MPAAAPAPAGRGCAVVGGAALGGAILGLIVGAFAGYGAGWVWYELTPVWNRAREMGIVVVMVFAPFGGIVGAILGAILFGRRASGRAPGWFDRFLLIACGVLVAMAVLGLALFPPLVGLFIS